MRALAARTGRRGCLKVRRPFLMTPIRWARRATLVSWVTSTMVRPRSRHMVSSRAMMSSRVSSSRLPVGSSAEQDLRLLDQRPGDGDPLLLAAGELAGHVPQPVAEADRLQRHGGALPPRGRADVQRDERGFHVLQGGEHRHQVEGLEDKADGLGPHLGHLGLAQLREVAPVEFDDAGRRPVQAAEHLQQRGLALPGGALDGQPFAVLDDQVHAAQGGDGAPALLVVLGHSGELVHLDLLPLR